MAVISPTPFSLAGLREVPLAATSSFTVWVDESELGLVFHKLTHPGQGLKTPYRCVGAGEARFERFIGRTDLPRGARMFASNLGLGGSWWIYGAGGWTLDRRFMLALLQGSRTAPLATLNSQAVGFNGFSNRGSDIPVGFWAPGRHVRIVCDVSRPQAHAATAATAIAVGGVAVLSAPWNQAANAQHIELDLWVSAANQLTSQAIVTYVTESPPAQVAQFVGDSSVPNLSTQVQNLSVGVGQTVPETEHFALFYLGVDVLA